MTTRGTSPQSRASTACSACRSRRTKCITDPGQTSCNYCRGKGQECTFHGSDERRRPKSKGYVISLLENIQTLEQQLREAGHEPPQLPSSASQTRPNKQKKQKSGPPGHDSTEDSGSRREQPSSSPADRPRDLRQLGTSINGDRGSSASLDLASEVVQNPGNKVQCQPYTANPPQDQNSVRPRRTSEDEQQPGDKTKTNVWTVIYGPDRLIYDEKMGRINYFSPATCYKTYMTENTAMDSWHLDKRSYRILADIPKELDNYLMEMFWDRYNNILGVIDQQAFRHDQTNGHSTYYSGFLHLICLAIGFQFADRERPGLRQVTLHDGSSLFHREAKYILDRELEFPRGLTIIQAMLLLSDLECAHGRDDLAAMHIGTACRLAFDFGLNLDCSGLDLSERGTKFRKDVLRSCMIYDRAWALYVGRPSNIKSYDIASSCLIRSVPSVSSSAASPQESTPGQPLSSIDDVHGQILDALLEIMELGWRIQEVAQPRLTPETVGDENRLIDVAALDTKLKSWYSTLPHRLRCTPENIKEAPRLFFMMHQQYHVLQIVLHGPYGHYENLVGVEAEKSHTHKDSEDDSSSTSPWQRLARSITMEAAMKVAQGFSSYRQRFGTCQASVLSLQQGGTACLALLCSVKASKTPEKRKLVLQHLYSLLEQLQEMSETYSPAKLMCSVVNHEMERLRIDFTEVSALPRIPEPPDFLRSPTAQTQRASGESLGSRPATKRRRLNTDCHQAKAPSTALPNPDPDQNASLPDTTVSINSKNTGHIPTVTPALDTITDSFSDPSLNTNYDSLDHFPDPTLDFDFALSPWPTTHVSETSALLEGQIQTQMDSDLLLPFSDDIFFGAIEGDFGVIPGMSCSMASL